MEEIETLTEGTRVFRLLSSLALQSSCMYHDKNRFDVQLHHECSPDLFEDLNHMNHVCSEHSVACTGLPMSGKNKIFSRSGKSPGILAI